jgi:thioester reductase-like protein
MSSSTEKPLIFEKLIMSLNYFASFPSSQNSLKSLCNSSVVDFIGKVIENLKNLLVIQPKVSLESLHTFKSWS